MELARFNKVYSEDKSEVESRQFVQRMHGIGILQNIQVRVLIACIWMVVFEHGGEIHNTNAPNEKGSEFGGK